MYVSHISNGYVTGVVAIEKGAFRSPSTTVASFTYIYMCMREREREREERECVCERERERERGGRERDCVLHNCYHRKKMDTT